MTKEWFLIGVLMVILVGLGSATATELTEEQSSACGAIMCIAGGQGVAECGPYLTRFFTTPPAGQQGFLDSCPGTDRNFNSLAARYADPCRPAVLTRNLNADLGSCAQVWYECQDGGTAIDVDGQPASRVADCGRCRAREQNAATRECGAWYIHEWVRDRAPVLTGQCQNPLDVCPTLKWVTSR